MRGHATAQTLTQALKQAGAAQNGRTTTRRREGFSRPNRPQKKALSSLFWITAMPSTARTFRIFVSSTFEDLKAERDALQRDVFPRLRKLCEQHGARFQAVDLRWGVRDEAALDQKTMEICLREIRRCQATGVRPNFIVLLGDRYGWQPMPPRVLAAEWDALRRHLGVTDSLADTWYRLDENAVPSEYVLQRRNGAATDPGTWSEVEQTLRPALAAAARSAGIAGKALSKYEDSATHQEILAGLGETEEDRQHVFGFFRRPSSSVDARLEAVKALIPNATEFTSDNVQSLCDAVYTRLAEIIESEARRFEDRPPLVVEVETHDRFAQDRSRVFYGRRKELEAITDYLCGGERRPLVLHGASGSGKSAVMAKASLEWRGPGRVIRRFIGASPASADGHGLLTGLCRQMAPGETPVDFVQLARTFQERLTAVADGAAEPMVLFLDALDQLAEGDPARDLSWLPRELPPGVKVIVATTVEAENLPVGVALAIEPMTNAEGEGALDEWLREAGRRLQPWQREKVLAEFELCGLPLYLKLAAEESRLWTSYASDGEWRLGDGVAGVIDGLFARLSSETEHGPVLVSCGLGYLAAARHGLTEDEILEVLTIDDAVWEDFDQHRHHAVSERRLPAVVWSRLSLDLEPYLSERAAPGGTVITFYHRQLAERTAARFLAGSELEARHQGLANYFAEKPAWLDDARNVANARRAVELPFQQRGAGDWKAAEATLLDCQFLLAKCAAELVVDLDADYRAVLDAAPQESLRLIHGAMVLSLHVLARDSRQYASQMVGRLLGHRQQPGVAKFIEEITEAAPRPWLRPLIPCLDAPGGSLLLTLEGHKKMVSSVAVTANGKRAVSASDDRTLKVWDLETGRALRTLEGHSDGVKGVALTADGKRAVSASADKTLKVWDLDTGRALRTLEGHSDGVKGVALTADGKRAVSASDDRTLKVWDLETGRELRTLIGHTGPVSHAVVTADERRVVSASWDKTLKVWDLKTGCELHTLEGHTEMVSSVAVTADGKRAVSAAFDKKVKVWDLETGHVLRTLEEDHWVTAAAVTADGKRAVSASSPVMKVWDLETGCELRTLVGHSGQVTDVAVTADGKRAVSASADSTLKVWDLESHRRQYRLGGHTHMVVTVAVTQNGMRVVSASSSVIKVSFLETGGECFTLVGHTGPVSHAVVTADERRVVSASWDKTLKVWDLKTGCELRTLEGHTDQVNSVAVTTDGKRAVSASNDRTLKVWNLETGREIRTLEGHTQWVDAVAVTADGRLAVSGSWDMTLRVWDLETGFELCQLNQYLPGSGVAMTAIGNRAVFGSTELEVLDLEAGTLVEVGSFTALHKVLALAADGERVVLGSDDDSSRYTLMLLDLEKRSIIATFECEGRAGCCAWVTPTQIVAGDDTGRLYFLALEH
jgi:WD40 repeat protein